MLWCPERAGISDISDQRSGSRKRERLTQRAQSSQRKKKSGE
jgi:hypothetical protein